MILNLSNEPFICMVLAYASYITAELLDMSAILSAVFCGFNMRKYVRHNMLPQSVTAFNYIVHLTAHVCEVSIFIWLGFVVAELDWTRSTDIALIAWVNAFCLVYRFMVTFSLCFVLNIWRTEKITILGQIILSFGGLRGGIAFSLMALAELPDTHLKDTLLIATISVICFTAFVQGILSRYYITKIKFALRSLKKRVFYFLFSRTTIGLVEDTAW